MGMVPREARLVYPFPRFLEDCLWCGERDGKRRRGGRERKGGREREEASMMMVTSLNVSSRFSPMMTSFISLARAMLDIECWYWGNNSFRGKGWGGGERGVLKRRRRLSVDRNRWRDDFRDERGWYFSSMLYCLVFFFEVEINFH